MQKQKKNEEAQRRGSSNTNELWQTHTETINNYKQQIQELQTKLEALSLTSEGAEVNQISSSASNPMADTHVYPVQYAFPFPPGLTAPSQALPSAHNSMIPGQPVQISPARAFYTTVVDFGSNIKK